MERSAIDHIMLARLMILPPYSYDDDEGQRDVDDYEAFFAANREDCLIATDRYLAAWHAFVAQPSSDAAFLSLLGARREFIAKFPFAYDELSDSDESSEAIRLMRGIYTEEARRDNLSVILTRFRESVDSIE